MQISYIADIVYLCHRSRAAPVGYCIHIRGYATRIGCIAHSHRIGYIIYIADI